MIVNGIEWTHPAIGGGSKVGYYGYDGTVLNATVGDLTLTARLITTDSYETLWAVKVERDSIQLCKVNFVRKELALTGAAALVEVFSDAA